MIHKFKAGGYNIVIDVSSGGIHSVDDLTYDILDNIEPPLSGECPVSVIEKLQKFYTREEIISCYNEVLEVFEDGLLFSETEETAGCERTDFPLRAMCLNISHDCNLRCSYCFADNGSFGGERTFMNSETAETAVDFLVKNSGDLPVLDIYFFGGEPLLNFEVLTKTVEYARLAGKKAGKEFRFSLTTNGTLLDDEKTEFINREIHEVVLSADGRKEVNDRVRCKADGSGIYDDIMPKFKRLAEGRNYENYCVRGTFSRDNTDFSKDVLSILDEGFDRISIEPAAAGSAPGYDLTEMEIPAVFREYDKLLGLIKSKSEEGKHIEFFPFKTDIYDMSCRRMKEKGCGSGSEYIAVVPDGRIFPCHQLAGENELCIGSVFSGFDNSETREKFIHSRVHEKPECTECWAVFLCSGGCNAEAFRVNGDISIPHRLTCMLTKKRLECAVALAVSEAERSGKI